jgi:hypothetical protein
VAAGARVPAVAGSLVSTLLAVKRRFPRIDPGVAVFALLLLGVLGTFGFIIGTDPDEEYALASTAHGLVYAWHRAISFELQAPLWFGLMSLWRSLDASVAFARIFSVVCVAASCFALRAVAVRVRPDIPAWPFVMLVALNPFSIYAALEIRLYAAALLLSALAFVAFFDGFLAGEKRAARVWFVALSLVSIYVEYYLGFALIGGFAALLAMRRFAALRAYLVAGAIVAAGAIPALLLALSEAGSVRQTLGGTGGLPLRHLAEPAFQFALPFAYRWYDESILRVLLPLYKVGLGLLVLFLVLGRPRLSARDWGCVAFAFGTWLAFVAAYPLMHVSYEQPRHFVGLFVPEMAACYAVLCTLRAPLRQICTLGIVLIYVACTTATLWTSYRYLSRPGDWRRLDAYVNAHAGKDDVVAVFAPDALPAFLRWYHGAAPVVAFPRTPEPERYDPNEYMVKSDDEARRALAQIGNGKRVWLVLYGQCDGEVTNYGCAHVAEAAAEVSPQTEPARFYDGEVAEVVPPPRQERKNDGRSLTRGVRIASGESPAARAKRPPLSKTASVYVNVFAAAAPNTP